MREQGGAPDIAWADRPFVFVGRFVAKKNIAFLLDSYALYRHGAASGGGAGRRRQLEGEVAATIAALALREKVEVTGSSMQRKSPAALRRALALLIPAPRSSGAGGQRGAGLRAAIGGERGGRIARHARSHLVTVSCGSRYGRRLGAAMVALDSDRADGSG